MNIKPGIKLQNETKTLKNWRFTLTNGDVQMCRTYIQLFEEQLVYIKPKIKQMFDYYVK